MCRTAQVVIAGGGASGMCAAVLLARAGLSVILLDKNTETGKKLSMTGNGRCNLSNLMMDASCYNEEAREKIAPLLGAFGVQETIGFFRSAGVLLREEEGYLYPVSGQALTIVHALREEMARYSVQVVLRTQVKDIVPLQSSGYRVRCSNGTAYEAPYVILATGGLSGPKSTMSTGDGYYLAERLGLHLKERFPALIRMRATDATLPRESGVRVHAEITFLADGQAYAAECGEVQITQEGISGIPVLQAGAQTAALLRQGHQITARLDLFPDTEADRWEALITDSLASVPGRTMRAFLNGFSNSYINDMLLARAGIAPETDAADLSEEVLRTLLQGYRALEIVIDGVADYREAQATAGGVDLADLTDTLEAKCAPGVYCIGELTDVDGRCGGYNLQWAWTGAMCVADAIINKTKNR